MFNLWKKEKKKNQNILEIKYDISSGIPFRWEYEIENKKICELTKSTAKGEKTKEPICGGNVETTYFFKGLKRGITIIRFKLINIGDGYISKIDEYKIEVDENLKINLISKEEKNTHLQNHE